MPRQLDEAHPLPALHVAPAESNDDETQVLPLMANPLLQPLHCPDVSQELQFAGIDEEEEEQQLPVRQLPDEHWEFALQEAPEESEVDATHEPLVRV